MTLKPLESAAVLTVLGVRFHDPVTDQPITDGLSVSAQRLNAARTARVGKRVAGVRTPSGVIAFHGLYPEAERAANFAAAAKRAVIDVIDLKGRYLPASFEVSIPLQGAFRGVGAWLPRPLMLPVPAPNSEAGVSLWSAPTRAIPDSLNAVYAQIVIGASDNPPPAAHAMVQIMNNSGVLVAVGFTDARGSVMIPVPYPAIPDPPLDAPLASLNAQEFAMRARVFYQSNPALRPSLPGSPVPDLAALLGQPHVQVARQNNSGTLVTGNRLDFTMKFELPAVLRTLRGTSGEPFLRIQP